jgi:hypothetical protein
LDECGQIEPFVSGRVSTVTENENRNENGSESSHLVWSTTIKVPSDGLDTNSFAA